MSVMLEHGLTFAGVLVLLFNQLTTRRLIAELPMGALRRRWYLLVVMIWLFIAGYLAYLIGDWNRNTWNTLITSFILFFGSTFVWLSTNAALQTIMDVRRVALLERENITDPLIGIYNRRYLDQRLDEEFSKARRYGARLSVLMLDLDYFKRVNDTYGHEAGDLVLCHVGKLVLAASRTSDIVTRYGGEEMLIIAPHTAIMDAMSYAERLRQYIATHPLILTSENRERQQVSVTVSIGVAEATEGVTDCGALVRNADRALYHAKKRGRNRVEPYAAVQREEP